jgi:hypothetical protein
MTLIAEMESPGTSCCGHADSARRPSRNDLALVRMPVTHQPLVAAVGQLVGKAAEQGRDFGLNRLHHPATVSLSKAPSAFALPRWGHLPVRVLRDQPKKC